MPAGCESVEAEIIPFLSGSALRVLIYGRLGDAGCDSERSLPWERSAKVVLLESGLSVGGRVEAAEEAERVKWRPTTTRSISSLPNGYEN